MLFGSNVFSLKGTVVWTVDKYRLYPLHNFRKFSLVITGNSLSYVVLEESKIPFLRNNLFPVTTYLSFNSLNKPCPRL